MHSDSRTSNRRVELQFIPDMPRYTGAWKSLSMNPWPRWSVPAPQHGARPGHRRPASVCAAFLQRGTHRQTGRHGLLPGTKYGRGWIFVAAQLIHHVVLECAGNIRAAEAPVVEQSPDTSQCRAELDHKRADPPPPLVPLNCLGDAAGHAGRCWMRVNGAVMVTAPKHCATAYTAFNRGYRPAPSLVSSYNGAACGHPAYQPHAPTAPRSTHEIREPSDRALHVGCHGNAGHWTALR